MAVNEKAVYATEWIGSGDPRRPFTPGDRIDGRLPAEVVRNLQERGLTTESHAEAQRAAGAEQARREDVARQIATRSEKRDHEKRVDRRG